MLEIIWLVIVFLLVKEGEYFVGYHLAISESGEYITGYYLALVIAGEYFIGYFLAISECWRNLVE